METCGQNILLQSAHLNFHVLVAHGNQQAGSLWINSRGDQLWKLCGAHSHQHPHLHCRKVTSTDNHLVSQRGHDGAEHIFTSFSSATQFQEQVRQVLIANVEEASVLNCSISGRIHQLKCSFSSAFFCFLSHLRSSAGYQYHFLQQQSSSFLFKSCRLLKHFQRMVRKIQ